ncbi:hypothetical protein [Enterococcus cecorum]|uniref:Sortase n=2 Tax=Enterococcus cecorum TaxID=44008 RepID=S1QYM5_9ENTE|nr:hypothetical protein [Enterococcus cecorum]EOX18826.1 hypothetical protein I567_00577 [Enterococcus cecorum DSM 20682 = ATCC 43198]ESK61445.1 hypothetical protein OMO_01508 [Enterococcus cecorum DSM 20682 = ATCC 43198]OJG34392.1 hypothetical protein RT42_GL000792 [Enterococcus cecorum DSM 20682 = ATCC 43198]CAI3417291.1 hypothetical protein CIRMBP1318_01081 [Enterococcus cecorum DSM 20682 = ATCC 43198]SQE56987.1 Uncharacterised protein [Enterococcus cecorum]
MKKLSKKFVQLSVVGTLLVAGGLFVAPQVQNLAAQASEPTKLVAFDQQANALGETINDVRESKTVTKTLAKAQETATKKQKEAQQKASQKVAETKVQVQNTATEQTSNDNQNAATTQTNEVTETTSINNTPNTNQAAVPQQSAPVQQSTPAQTTPAPQVDTSGFNFNGHHYPIAWFSGSGYVPADGNIYRWSEMPNHYLIERAGMAGGTIRELGVGSKITIDGQTYTVFKVLSGVANDENAFNLLTSQGAAITFQSCDATYGANGLANLTIWFAA